MSSLPVNKSKFKQIAKAVAAEEKLKRDSESVRGSFAERRPGSRRKKSSATAYDTWDLEAGPDDYNRTKREHSKSQASSGDEGSDLDGGPGDAKKQGLVYQKTENFWTRIRDWIAMSDVFISRRENPPFVACLQVSVWFIPILLIMCIWDTLAVTVFEIPYLSTVYLPGFFLLWHLVMLILAMYGFMLSYLSSGPSPRTKLAGISVGVHYLLLLYRVFMEIFFDGYRGQWKLYYENTKKQF